MRHFPIYLCFIARRRLILPLVERCTDSLLGWRNAQGVGYADDARMLDVFLKRVSGGVSGGVCVLVVVVVVVCACVCVRVYACMCVCACVW